MIDDIKYLIQLVGGASNAISIIALFIGVFISLFLYFKTFYRLVFSTEKICENIVEFGDWAKEQKEFITRVIFYNNGRKTLTRIDVKKLTITTNGRIISSRLLEENNKIKFKLKNNNINLDIEYLDSSKFFILEIKHEGNVQVEGRVSETGEILHTEPRYWIVVNVVFMIYLLFSLFQILINLEEYTVNQEPVFINFFLIILVGLTIRFIHAKLFIPDSIIGKYLDAKDKLANQFKNKFNI